MLFLRIGEYEHDDISVGLGFAEEEHCLGFFFRSRKCLFSLLSILFKTENPKQIQT